ncbi:hypothetical protein [Phenylobacterium sp.]|uniref:hypothetical protein n=1 Tax=Phenylobacterium sp. TaxID=1871053 RepID=UPI0030F3849F
MIGRSAVHYVRFVVGLDQPQMQTTPAEPDVLSSFLPGAKRIVEVGVFEGFTTRVLAEGADRDAVVIYGIDPCFSGRLGISLGEAIAGSTTAENSRAAWEASSTSLARMSTRTCRHPSISCS